MEKLSIGKPLFLLVKMGNLIKDVKFKGNLSQDRNPIIFDRFDDGAIAIIHIPKKEEIAAYKLATMRNKKLEFYVKVIGDVKEERE